MDIFNIPVSKTPEAYKPKIDPEPAAAATTATATAPASEQQPLHAFSESKSAEKADTKSKSVSEVMHSKPHKAVVVVVDILIIIAIILGACFALVKFVPDSGAAELITKGVVKMSQFFGSSSDESSAAEKPEVVNGSYIMPITDGNTLISSQLYNNYNIADVRYDPQASWADGASYSIEGAAAAKPIDDDYWKDGSQGPIRYDESAVGAVIRFDSGLVEYINNGSTNLLNDIAIGSAAEKKLAEYVATVKQISIDKLGIGDIRKNGDDLYVWTNETVTEAKGGSPVQREFTRLYLLTPDVDEYKVSDFEDIS
ncbi:MAG: hypothetical protein LBT52_05935 [Clostridiales Family XIII bacterium]|nr:hypothetical protein [Clostridiales Family XIII bacterium]